jgi:predicted DNA-binding transcriptional regulator AlpA
VISTGLDGSPECLDRARDPALAERLGGLRDRAATATTIALDNPLISTHDLNLTRFEKVARQPWRLDRLAVEGYRFAVQVDSHTELVIAVEIAKRLQISPQRVNVLVSGPGFPKPLGKLGRSAVWRWSSIERWARETGRLPATGTPH